MDQDARREVVRAMLEKGMSRRAISETTGIPRTTVRRVANTAFKREDPPAERVAITGLTPADHMLDGLECITTLIREQAKSKSKQDARYNQHIEIPGDKPACIAWMSDHHFGNSNTDYQAILDDTQFVLQTDGMYAVAAGDYHENWLGKLAMINADQPVTIEQELAMVDWWLGEIDPKLLAVVAGNHDARTKKWAGWDHIKFLLRGKRLLYDADEVLFTVCLGAAKWRVAVRHNFPGYSKYNHLHGAMNWNLFNGKADILVSGHTHRGLEWARWWDSTEQAYKLGILVGTYKQHDRYALQLGFPRSPHDASGAVTFFPDGRIQPHNDLGSAAEFVAWARKR